MTLYITRGQYTQHALEGMIKHPDDRADVASKMIKAAGGRMLEYYVTQGDHDFMLISEFDNEIDALSSLLVAAGTAGVRNLNTVTAVRAKELRAAEEKARKLVSKFEPALA